MTPAYAPLSLTRFGKVEGTRPSAARARGVQARFIAPQGGVHVSDARPTSGARNWAPLLAALLKLFCGFTKWLIHCPWLQWHQQERRYSLFTRVMIASYATFSGPSLPSSGRQPPERILPSSLNVPVYFDPSVQCVTILP